MTLGLKTIPKAGGDGEGGGRREITADSATSSSLSSQAAVISFLHNQTELNLTASADAGEWDSEFERGDPTQARDSPVLLSST